MKNHLENLYKYLIAVDKSAAISVNRHIRKTAAGPFDPPENWERYPEDQEGVWDSNWYGDSKESLDEEVLEEEAYAIKKYLRRHEELNGGVYEIVSIERIKPIDSDGRKVWRVITKYRSPDPMELPLSNIEWEIWEVNPGEYGYSHSIEIPGTDKRIYGEA